MQIIPSVLPLNTRGHIQQNSEIWKTFQQLPHHPKSCPDATCPQENDSKILHHIILIGTTDFATTLHSTSAAISSWKKYVECYGESCVINSNDLVIFSILLCLLNSHLMVNTVLRSKDSFL